jgi:hypothetical protein
MPRALTPTMESENDEQAFLRDLVKASRQKCHAVKWVDRDGSERITMLTQADLGRLNALAQAKKISKSEVLRQAAFQPVQR